MVVAPETNLQHDQFIEQQLARTRRRVKWVDLGSIAMGLIGGIIAYLLLVVLCDHWIADLGRIGRLTALAILLLGITYCVAAFLVPPFLRRINPAYAARAIEQSDPSLKNSLINFLMFRRDPTPTNRLVYQALRQRAAWDLRRVNIDLAVDRTKLIHVGYLVVALMVLFAVYTIFSPKDAFQTVLRVAAPWADLPRPSRVSINEVWVARGTQVQSASTPMTLVYGDRPTVSARILGLRADESATLFFSTADKQTVDQAVPLTCPADGQRYACVLPPDPTGLRQSVTYWIEAGDARSSEFALTVSDMPMIVVERVEYKYPAYTQMPDLVVEKNGEIQALENTRVIIHARANHVIRSARIEFDPDPAVAPVDASGEPVTSDGRTATYGFDLRLKPDRLTPEHTTYRLSMTADNGLGSQDPAIHRIQVSRDLPPEIAILTPRNADIELAANRTQRIEIRALDPDFGLASVTLQARCNGKELVNQNLLTNPTHGTAPETVTYDFAPGTWGLAPGDKVTYWAEAADNRTAKDGSPEPNRTRTADQFITIVGSEPEAAPQDDRDPAAQDAQQPPDAQSSRADSPAAANQQPPAPGDAHESPTPADQGTGDQNQTQSDNSDTSDTPQTDQAENRAENQTENQAQQPQSSGASQSDNQPQESDQTQKSDAGQEGETGQQSDPAQQGDQSQSGQQQTDPTQSDQAQSGQEESAGQGGQSEQTSSSSDGAGAPSQPSAAPGATSEPGAPGEQSPTPATDAAGGVPDSTQAPAPGTGSAPAGADAQGGSDAAPDARQGERDGGNPSGANTEPLHDGEAFERALQLFENSSEAGKAPPDPLTKPDADDAPQRSAPPPDATSNSTNPAVGSSESGGDDDAQQPGQALQDAAGRQGENADPRDGPGPQSTGHRTPKNPEGTDQTQNPDEEPLERQEGVSNEGQAGSDSPSSGSPSSGSPGSDSSGSDSSSGGSSGSDSSSGDSPGSDTTSETGNADSPESGQDGTADRTGDKQLAPETTGQSEQTPGAGTQSVETPEGQEATPRGASPQNPDLSPATPTPADPSAQPRSEGGTRSGPPESGGLPGETADPASPPPADLLREADAVNLEYARRATDLVLERLRDQQHDPDPELLKSLGWTREELQRFVARWQELKRAAREEGPAAQADLDDALRSLGLRATQSARRRGTATSDQAGGQLDRGRTSRLPAGFLEQFEAYKRGAARGTSDGGVQRP